MYRRKAMTNQKEEEKQSPVLINKHGQKLIKSDAQKPLINITEECLQPIGAQALTSNVIPH